MPCYLHDVCEVVYNASQQAHKRVVLRTYHLNVRTARLSIEDFWH